MWQSHSPRLGERGGYGGLIAAISCHLNRTFTWKPIK